jgi:hypothetical protein
MKIIEMGSKGGLNIRELFRPLFFEPVTRHPDMKRQRSRRQWSKDRAAARAFKAREVPLYFVDSTVCLWDRLRGRWNEIDARKAASVGYKYQPSLPSQERNQR